jgi:hypothetical protein
MAVPLYMRPHGAVPSSPVPSRSSSLMYMFTYRQEGPYFTNTHSGVWTSGRKGIFFGKMGCFDNPCMLPSLASSLFLHPKLPYPSAALYEGCRLLENQSPRYNHVLGLVPPRNQPHIVQSQSQVGRLECLCGLSIRSIGQLHMEWFGG